MTLSMSAQSFQIAFVVWRESLEALLVVGILVTWSLKSAPDKGRLAMRAIAAGVVCGLVLATALAALTNHAASAFNGHVEDIVQMLIAFAACLLIIRIVFWMRRIEKGATDDLCAQAMARTSGQDWLGLVALTALAMAREGAETVLFLYGILSPTEVNLGRGVLPAGAGLLFAAATYWSFKLGSFGIPKRTFLGVSQGLLLALGSGLMMTAIDKAISIELVSPMSAPLWDSSWLLDDSSGFGAFLAGVIGYRSRLELLPVLGMAIYWATTSFAFVRPIDARLSA
ncbi:iron permease [Rhizobium sp. R72]|uniref:FTR1 family iron permease n=1 Tax=unclassified Rhizobium TaxID=2613769 RepID=UPI000B52B2F5|nr:MULTISPECIES: FTR1 family protein [unclassified Rhizobium]OWV97588.1 iron permease [Rhizobium sp. R72]OWV97927.1 iron permease [Rhizobium sp. R711]